MTSKQPSKTSPKKSPHSHRPQRGGGASAPHAAWSSNATPQATATRSTEACPRSPASPPPLTATFTGAPEPPELDTASSQPAPCTHNSHAASCSLPKPPPQQPPPPDREPPHVPMHDPELATLAAESALSEPEQEAYDLGLADGDQGFDDDTECPSEYLDTPHLREAYLNGHAIGTLNRRERHRQARPHPYACCDCHAPFHLHHRPAGECAEGELCAPCWEARGERDEPEEDDGGRDPEAWV